MPRHLGMSVRLKLALSYAGITAVSGVLLLAAVGLFLFWYAPDALSDQVPNRSDLLFAFAPIATAALILLSMLGFCAGWILTGPTLAPLIPIGHAAQLAAQGSLSHRIALSGPVDEFREIADAFDSMLEHLEAQVGEQQRFAANASHELRTPLAISKTLLEVARTDPKRDVEALIARLEKVNTRAIHLTETLLLFSQVERRSFTPDSVDLSLVAEEAAETLLADAERRHVSLEIHCNTAFLLGSPVLLQQLTVSLLHNAIVHNLPEGGVAWVHTHATSEAVTLEVENTGASFSPSQVATFTELFQRQTGRTRSDDHAGFGLGLAIAQRIAQAHKGSLHLAPREGGGLTVTAVFTRP